MTKLEAVKRAAAILLEAGIRHTQISAHDQELADQIEATGVTRNHLSGVGSGAYTVTIFEGEYSFRGEIVAFGKPSAEDRKRALLAELARVDSDLAKAEAKEPR